MKKYKKSEPFKSSIYFQIFFWNFFLKCLYGKIGGGCLGKVKNFSGNFSEIEGKNRGRI